MENQAIKSNIDTHTNTIVLQTLERGKLKPEQRKKKTQEMKITVGYT